MLPTASDEDATRVFPGAQARPADVPNQVGAYHLLRRLGEGGMGEVWLAEQKEPIERTVALKLVRLGMDTRQFVARFESERQALALMHHPAIASVIDGGATETGRPYLVMEYVEGVPITDYCELHRLTIRQRLELFVQVCEGVQHAHQKGIIHRDLKPSNVLVAEVDGRPAPKIIDFGLAKAITQSLTEKSVHTVLGGWIGTPAYMSPEQAEITGDIDTRTDVYSLGVMLYRLLTGMSLFDERTFEGAGFDDTRRVIREVVPPRPSTRVSAAADTAVALAEARQMEPRALVQRLKGDLDWIVMKAVAKEKELRYGSAAELAADIERHLTSQPVVASPPSRVYRLRKFVKRHRVGAAAGGAVLVTLLLGVIVATWQAVRATRAESRLRLRQAQAEDLISFMVGDLRTKLEEVGRLEILDEVGAQALEYFATVDQSEYSDAELLRRSQVLTQIGDMNIKLGNTAAALEPLREALVVAEDLVARGPEDGARWIGLGAAHFWLGYVHKLRGDTVAARQDFDGYLAAAERLVALDPERAEWRLELAYAHNGLGTLIQLGLPPAEAVEHFQRAVDMISELAEADPTNMLLRRELANGRSWLGDSMIALGRLRDALDHLQANLGAMEELASREPNNLDWMFRLGIAHSRVASVLHLLGESDLASRHRRESLRIQERLAASDPSNSQYQRELAAQHSALALIAATGGNLEESLLEYERAEGILRAIRALDESNNEFQRQLTSTLIDFGNALLVAESFEPALDRTREAVSILETLSEENPGDDTLASLLAAALLAEGAATEASRGPSAARPMRLMAVGLLESRARGSSNPRLLEPLARAYLDLGRTDDARALSVKLQQMGFRPREFVSLCERHGITLPRS
jgi:serine/threonine-protein kinase